MNKELTEAERKAIMDQAEKKYPYFFDEGEDGHAAECRERKAYIAALTAERQRSKELVDTLQGFIDNYDHDNDAHRYNNTAACRVCAAEKALSNYQNKAT